jgi:hypothetical protein
VPFLENIREQREIENRIQQQEQEEKEKTTIKFNSKKA